MRIYDLGTESIWLDEAFSIDFSAYYSVGSIIEESASTQTHPPLYFILLHFWINLFGTSEVATRSLSAIFGIISILLIYQVGSTLFNRKVGLISGFLSAISSYHIYYSQEARSYTFLLLLSLLSYFLFIKILRGDRRWYYPCYFLTNLLLGYTHFYGLFIIASQALFFFLFWNKYKPQRVRFLGTLVISIIALLPLVSLLGGKVVAIAERGFWIREPQLIDILGSLARFTGSGGAGQEFLLFTFITLVLFGLLSIRRLQGKWVWRRPLESLNGLSWSVRLESIEEELLLFLWLSLSIVIPFIESKIMTPIYLTKYMIGASPALYLLVAKGTDNLTNKRILYPVLAFVVLLSSFGLYSYYKSDVKPQWREVANFIEISSKVDTDVAVFCASYIQRPFAYYYKGELQQFGIGKNVEDTQELAALVDNAVQEKDRLWLILAHVDQKAPIRPYLEDRYGIEAVLLEQKFKGILVILFDFSAP